jgi:hypothetical protein
VGVTCLARGCHVDVTRVMVIYVFFNVVIWLYMWLYGYRCGYTCGYMLPHLPQGTSGGGSTTYI